jgi:hypothetical protein
MRNEKGRLHKGFHSLIVHRIDNKVHPHKGPRNGACEYFIAFTYPQTGSVIHSGMDFFAIAKINTLDKIRGLSTIPQRLPLLLIERMF